jgi:hypothetical protein
MCIFLYIISIILSIIFYYFKQILIFISHNVKVVYDISGVAETAKQFQQPQKCGGEKTHKGRSTTGFFRSPSRFSGEAYTILLYAV